MKEELMQSVEIEAGLPMRHNKDFIQLAELVFRETHEHISPTTLKRLWGYVSDQNCEPRVSTLDLLSRLLGYRNFNDFSKDGGGKWRQRKKRDMDTSGMFLNGACFADDLTVGEEIVVSWKPERECRFRYLGNKRFEVVEAVNAKISVGDTFCCDAFINGTAMYVNRLTHGGRTGLMYAAGKDGGIRFKRVLTKKDLEEEALGGQASSLP